MVGYFSCNGSIRRVELFSYSLRDGTDKFSSCCFQFRGYGCSQVCHMILVAFYRKERGGVGGLVVWPHSIT